MNVISQFPTHQAVDDEGTQLTDADLEPLGEPLGGAGDGGGARPTLFLGLGGTAALVVAKLRRRLCERFGGMHAMPCWQLLLFDTEANTPCAAESGASDEALSPAESVFLPLRRPADYRAASGKLLGWLSRRWLYSIPRSLRTEGLRPLGRLVYVDHAERIAERIRRALVEITSDSAKAKSAETTGAPLRCQSPRVFIVSSICGGAGGGMLFDVAYAARRILTELGLPSVGVCGVLTHGTLNKRGVNDLRKTNAYATLTEWNHFSSGASAYPADRLSVAPACEQAEAPFGESYLIDLGDNLSEADFEAAAASVARYLYLDAATPCGAALDRCRELSRARSSNAVKLRTFGLSVVGCDKQTAANIQANLLCQHVIGRWHGDGRPVDSASLHLDTSELGIDPLGKRLFAAADKALGGKAEVHFRTLLAQPTLIAPASASDTLARIDALFGAPRAPEGQTADAPSRFVKALGDAAKKLTGSVSDSIVGAAAALVEEPRGRLPAALAAAAMFQEHLRSLRQQAEELFRQAHADATALRAKLFRGDGSGSSHARWFQRWGGSSPQDGEARLLAYCEGRLRALVYEHLVALLQSTGVAIAALNEKLVRLRPRLEQLGHDFEPSSAAPSNGGQATRPSLRPSDASARAELNDPAFLRGFDEQLQREWIEPKGGLLALGAAGDEAWNSLREQMQSRSRAAMLAAMNDVDAAKQLVERNPEIAQQTRSLAAEVDKALPRLSRIGGAKRLLAVVPESRHGHKLAETALRDLPALALTVFDSEPDLVLCHEAEGLSPARVAAALIDNRPDYADAARRVLTRTDIRWSSLPLTGDETRAPNDNPAETSGADETRDQDHTPGHFRPTLPPSMTCV